MNRMKYAEQRWMHQSIKSQVTSGSWAGYSGRASLFWGCSSTIAVVDLVKVFATPCLATLTSILQISLSSLVKFSVIGPTGHMLAVFDQNQCPNFKVCFLQLPLSSIFPSSTVDGVKMTSPGHHSLLAWPPCVFLAETDYGPKTSRPAWVKRG